MKWLLLGVLGFFLFGCASGLKIPEGARYLSPIGNFSCGPMWHEMRVEQALGPVGGTIRINGPYGVLARIDVEKFDPAITDKAQLEEIRNRIYEGYLAENIMPLIRSGVGTAQLISAEHAEVDGLKLYRSAVLVPGGSNVVKPDKSHADGVRGQVQYTDGRYIFTVSRIVAVRPNASMEDLKKAAYESATTAFRQCHFPK